jgi:hypothetical protein
MNNTLRLKLNRNLRREYLCVRRSAAVIVLIALLAGRTLASDLGSARISTIRVPNGGEAVDAKIGSDGTIHLLYDSGDIPFYVKSSDRGATFSQPIPIVNKEARRPGLIFSGWALAVGRRNRVYVAMSTNNWQVKLDGVPVGLVYATLAPGAKAFTPVRSLNNQPSEGFSLAADEKADVAAAWLSGKLYANVSHDSGKTFTSNTEINSSYNPCDCCTTRAAYGANGDLAVLYREETNNDRDMYVVIFNKSGQQSRTRISSTLWHINACPMTYFALTSANDGYLAAWPTRGDIYFARLDKNGKVLPPGEIKTPGHSGMRTGLVALGAPDETTLVAWKDRNNKLMWQLYDPAGHPQNAPESISSPGKGAAGVVDGRGHFILFN